MTGAEDDVGVREEVEKRCCREVAIMRAESGFGASPLASVASSWLLASAEQAQGSVTVN